MSCMTSGRLALEEPLFEERAVGVKVHNGPNFGSGTR